MHIEFKPSSDFNNVKINPGRRHMARKLLSCNINWARILTAEAMWNALKDRKIMAISNEITGYIFGEGRQGQRLSVPEKCFNSIATRNKRWI